MTGVNAWTGAEMRQSNDWIDILNAAEREELDQALQSGKTRGPKRGVSSLLDSL